MSKLMKFLRHPILITRLYLNGCCPWHGYKHQMKGSWDGPYRDDCPHCVLERVDRENRAEAARKTRVANLRKRLGY